MVSTSLPLEIHFFPPSLYPPLGVVHLAVTISKMVGGTKASRGKLYQDSRDEVAKKESKMNIQVGGCGYQC
ncbi:unnamed protein product [Lactuca virosa]|uniref:Uncharacterized protein n=1 Tax=Lactuca virosa TaxID=75947 RepID=A0AAU9NUN6_9ASTR|nr:unnamed protein product [Lactuca virosa]